MHGILDPECMCLHVIRDPYVQLGLGHACTSDLLCGPPCTGRDFDGFCNLYAVWYASSGRSMASLIHLLQHNW